MAGRHVVLAAVLLGAFTACNEVDAQQPQPPIPTTPAPPDQPTSVIATCFLSAQAQTNLTDAQIKDLCLGTRVPTGPVDCYTAAEDELLLTDVQQLVLCRCADSAQPVGCFARLTRESFLVDRQIIELCAPGLAYDLQANCLPAN